MKIEYRQATVKDAVSLGELLLKLHNIHYEGRKDIFTPTIQNSDMKQIINHMLSFNIIYIAKDIKNNKDIGFIAFSEIKHQPDSFSQLRHKMSIHDVYVDEQYRRNHIGEELINICKRLSVDKGNIPIELSVWQFNDAALEFYKKQGFVCMTQHMEYKG